MTRFFALTGLDPVSLRNASGSPGFIAGILDFVLADERTLLAVAVAQETTPEAIVRARHRLDHPAGTGANDIGLDGPHAAAGDDDWPPRPHDDWA